MKFKSFAELTVTPAQVTKQAVDKLFHNIGQGSIRSARQAELFAMNCGQQGEQLVKRDAGFRVARWLLS